MASGEGERKTELVQKVLRYPRLRQAESMAAGYPRTWSISNLHYGARMTSARVFGEAKIVEGHQRVRGQGLKEESGHRQGLASKKSSRVQSNQPLQRTAPRCALRSR